MAGREAMIRSMEKCLGMREPNKIQQWYRSRNGSAYNYNFPWCNATITWAAVDSGNHGTVCFGTDYAYTVAHAQRFKNAGRWHSDIAGIRRGDIVFFDWGGTNSIGKIDHVGIVTSVKGGTVYTIEGNTANVCARRVRYASTIAGYGRPSYSSSGSSDGSSSTGSSSSSVARYKTTINGLTYGYGAKGAHVTAVGKALVKAGFGEHYKVGPGPTWSDSDTKNYAAYQHSLGYRGGDADGVPGETSLKKLMGKLPAKKAPAKSKPKPPPFPGRQYFLLGARNAHAKQLQQWLHKGNWGPRYLIGPSTKMTRKDLAKVAALQRHYLSALGPADGLTGPKTWQYAWEVANGLRKK